MTEITFKSTKTLEELKRGLEQRCPGVRLKLRIDENGRFTLRIKKIENVILVKNVLHDLLVSDIIATVTNKDAIAIKREDQKMEEPKSEEPKSESMPTKTRFTFQDMMAAEIKDFLDEKMAESKKGFEDFQETLAESKRLVEAAMGRFIDQGEAKLKQMDSTIESRFAAYHDTIIALENTVSAQHDKIVALEGYRDRNEARMDAAREALKIEDRDMRMQT